MEQCVTVGCTKPAEVLHFWGADVSMTSTYKKSVRTVALCKECAAQTERMKVLNK
jgi:hypothetical protein